MYCIYGVNKSGLGRQITGSSPKTNCSLEINFIVLYKNDKKLCKDYSIRGENERSSMFSTQSSKSSIVLYVSYPEQPIYSRFIKQWLVVRDLKHKLFKFHVPEMRTGMGRLL